MTIKNIKKIYITTPIFYINDEPHIGHAYTVVAADVLARYYRLLGYKVFFVTGTDEHGEKIAQAAQKKKQPIDMFCNEIVKKFIISWKRLNISNDFFIRTTNPKHKKNVQKILKRLYDKGYIYKGVYEGFYCTGCEKTLTESDLINNQCPLHPNQKITLRKEINYFFKLSKFRQLLITAIKNSKNKNHFEILPEEKKREILGRLREELKDLPISRSTVEWGVKIPWDTSQTCYVWIDALFNYWTATQISKQKDTFWPPDLQLIGKDILWFHTVIWPSLLLAINISLPKKIFAHGFFTINNQKMSKSIGNVISPNDLIEMFGVDASRYLLLSMFFFGKDGDVSMGKFMANYNDNLANGLGNTISRLIGLSSKTRLNTLFNSKIDDFYFIQKQQFMSYRKLMESLDFNGALGLIREKISKIDKTINSEKLWELKNTSNEAFEKSLTQLFNELYEINLLIKPFLPATSQKIQRVFLKREFKNQILFPRK